MRDRPHNVRRRRRGGRAAHDHQRGWFCRLRDGGRRNANRGRAFLRGGHGQSRRFGARRLGRGRLGFDGGRYDRRGRRHDDGRCCDGRRRHLGHSRSGRRRRLRRGRRRRRHSDGARGQQRLRIDVALVLGGDANAEMNHAVRSDRADRVAFGDRCPFRDGECAKLREGDRVAVSRRNGEAEP